MSNLDEAQDIVSKIAELNNQLEEFGIIKQKCKIPDDFAKWFCLHKYSFELSNTENSGYFAVSNFGEKIQIKSKIGSDIDFPLTFNDVDMNKLDCLLIVFLDKETWVFDSIYKVSHNVVKDFFDSEHLSFKWNRESRSLSLQIFPEEDNMLTL